MITDEDGRIERFLEKPSWGEVFSDTINTGIYVLEPEVLDAHPRRRAVRLLEGALPAAARGRRAALRIRRRRLLAGHREPDPVPGGEPRRPRRQGELDIPGIRLRENIYVGEGVARREHRAHQGTGGDRQLLRDRPERADRPLHGARQQRDRQGLLRDGVLRRRTANTYLGPRSQVRGAVSARTARSARTRRSPKGR